METDTVIIDNGSGYIKAGFASQNDPLTVIPTIIGKPKYQNEFFDLPYDPRILNLRRKKKQKFKKLGATFIKDMIGEKVSNANSIYNGSFPIQKGRIANIDDLLEIYNNIYFKDLKTDPSNSPLLLTRGFTTSNACCKKLLEMGFEALKVPIFGLVQQTNLPLKSKGLSNGIVVESGHGSTQITAVVDDFVLEHNRKTDTFFSGETLSNLILDHLSRSKAYELDAERHFSVIEDIKRRFCEVSLSPDPTQIETKSNRRVGISLSKKDSQYKNIDFSNFTEKNIPEKNEKRIYELPDGSIVDLRKLPNITSDLFFNPYHYGYEGGSLGEIVLNTIESAEFDNRRLLAGCVLFSGGNGEIKGIKEKMEWEFAEKTNLTDIEFRVQGAEGDGKLAVWRGAMVLKALDEGFKGGHWVRKEEYEEHGLRIVERFLRKY